MNQIKTMNKTTYNDILDAYEPISDWPEWIGEAKEKALTQFRENGFPSRKEEAWKYIALKPLVSSDVLVRQIEDVSFDEDKAQTDVQITLVDGVSRQYSNLDRLPEGVIFSSFRQLVPAQLELLDSLQLEGINDHNPFKWINTFMYQDAILLYVPEGVIIEAPLFLNMTCSSEDIPVVSHPHVQIILEAGAEASVMCRFGDKSIPSVSNGALDLSIGEESIFEWVSLIEGHDQTQFFDTVHAALNRKSSLTWSSFVTGGRLVRQDIQVQFNGEDANCRLNGLALLKSDNQCFSHTIIHHKVPSGVSHQLFKNVLGEKSRSEYNGLVYVYPKAHKTDSVQSNRNLLLSDDARALARPQLRIDADDVVCAHGSNTGQLNDEEIFYLRSRGMSEAQAKEILTFGFVEEVIDGIKQPIFRSEVSEKIKASLPKGTGV
jgi:Fe-S cluster assembly protein SufD